MHEMFFSTKIERVLETRDYVVLSTESSSTSPFERISTLSKGVGTEVFKTPHTRNLVTKGLGTPLVQSMV